MKRKKKSLTFSAIAKKSTLSGIIFLLLTALFQLSESFITVPERQLPSINEPIELYCNQAQDDLTYLYLTAINSAQESVTFVIYSLLDSEIIDALKCKCESGVPVHIVCDAKASPGISRKLPSATIVRRSGQGLMHQKILVIDNKQVLFGSANMTTDSLKLHGNLVMAFEHPNLAEAVAAKAMSMDDEGNHSPLAHLTFTAGYQQVELWELPDNKDGASRVQELLRSAKKSIRVAMFTWTRQDFTQELIAAQLRGVKVDAVVDRYSGKGASAKVVKMLSEAGIPVRLSTGQGLLHYKFAWIDEEVLVSGSANWTTAAFKTNDDYFIVLYPLTTSQQGKMGQLWKTVWLNSEGVS